MNPDAPTPHGPVTSTWTWLWRLRLRVIVFVIGIPLAAFGAISLGPAWITLPIVGMAFAAVTVSVNKLTQRLAQQVCWTCGSDLTGLPAHEHGIACPSCGSLNQHNPDAAALVLLPAADADDADSDSDSRGPVQA